MTEWVVPVPPELVDELRRTLETNDAGWQSANEVVVKQFNGLKVEIFSDEHPPPHFRVSKNGETNNFRIADGEPLYDRGLGRYWTKIRKWHAKNKSLLINKWNEMRPTDCPVGEYNEH